MRGRIVASLATALALAGAPATAQSPPVQNYARNCSPCHGARMLDPQGAADLRKFPRDERERFIDSVTRGKNQMPPWGGLLKPEEVEALWAYVVAGGKI